MRSTHTHTHTHIVRNVKAELESKKHCPLIAAVLFFFQSLRAWVGEYINLCLVSL